MEQILGLLKNLMGTGSMLGSIPKPIRVCILYFTAFVGVFVIWKTIKDPSTKFFLIIAILILAAICGVYYLMKALKEKKKNEGIREDINQHSSATPRSLSDPGQRARLEDLRRKFQSGVDAYKSRGKDLYKLPWYVIVGEPGSGKTEAVRHSNVGFPPGMQDEFQGVGGTINMNWWFTNHAVLLDTAGRLMFEDVKPGETSEWKEFLTLLKKNRPNCPINGLFLVIPSDSLIKDSADSIQKKAGKIAQQLDVIQRVLDVRFPVFVIVTKCDKINGFREFFDNLTDPQLQHQMMGWSNPSPLDDPFKPEMVDKHLEQVSTRLRRRRLGLMRDPVPENPENRRTDELDTLYAFPHSLELLSSRLRRYLETIFIAGEWSAKPLFLRGIYFSSSMREGSALDAELADAMGVGVEDLPEGKVWERERAYFLRDLFLEKVFREKGLVTRATNTRTMLRTQKLALYGFGFAGLAVFATLAWFALGHLKNSIKDQGDYWHVVSTNGWQSPYWRKSIVPFIGDGSFKYAISTDPVQVENKSMSLGEFHAKLRDLAQNPLGKTLFFPGLADKYNQNRFRAQRTVFEAGVVRPMIEAARQKMRESGESASFGQPDALAALIQLESDVYTRGTGTNHGTLTPESAQKFLAVLESYVAGNETAPDTNLVAVMSWTYSNNEKGKGEWVPVYFSGRRGESNNLAANSAIASGLKAFVANATNDVKIYKANWHQIDSLRSSVKEFAKAEDALFAAADGPDDKKFLAAEHDVEAARASLDTAAKAASANALFSGGLSLAGAQQTFRAGIMNSAGARFGHVREVNDAALAQTSKPLFKEIQDYLNAVNTSISNQIGELLAQNNVTDFQAIDENYFAANAFATRGNSYLSAGKLMAEKPFANASLLGVSGEQLDTFLKKKISPVRAEASKYSGKLADKFSKVIDRQLKLAERAQSQAYFTAYFNEAKQQLARYGKFPLIRDCANSVSPEDFRKAGDSLKFISDDFSSAVFTNNNPADYVADWKRLRSNVQTQQKIVSAVISDDGFRSCKVYLEALPKGGIGPDEEWRGNNYRGINLNCSKDYIETGSSEEVQIGVIRVDQKLQLCLSKRVEDPSQGTFSIPIDAQSWGPLSVLCNPSAKPDASGKTTWHVQIPFTAKDAKGSVHLKLVFEQALPDFDNWPVASL
jgi:IcmF-related N-terminal domain